MITLPREHSPSRATDTVRLRAGRRTQSAWSELLSAFRLLRSITQLSSVLSEIRSDIAVWGFR